MSRESKLFPQKNNKTYWKLHYKTKLIATAIITSRRQNNFENKSLKSYMSYSGRPQCCTLFPAVCHRRIRSAHWPQPQYEAFFLQFNLRFREAVTENILTVCFQSSSVKLAIFPNLLRDHASWNCQLSGLTILEMNQRKSTANRVHLQ